MSDSVAFDPSKLPARQDGKPAHRVGIAAYFKATLESLVAAQTKQSEDGAPPLYRFPPL